MNSAGNVVQIDLETLRKLGPAAAELGISLPGETRFALSINASQPVRSLALELGRLVAQQNLFLKAGELVTVDKATGEERSMTPTRFVGWVEAFCSIQPRRESSSLSRELATLVLAQDIFRECIRPLDGVHLMRLPVRRAGGVTEFLEAGYDAESRIFTAPVLEYDMTWPAEQGLKFLAENNDEWPWAWPEDKRGDLQLNRSYAVHIAAMLGMYCRAMFAPGTARPMITYIANQPGTGKSTLVAMILIMLFGRASTAKTPRDDDKMSAELETVAQSMMPYLFFDDIGAGLFSSPLNRFITSESHTGRIYGQNREMFQVPNVTQVFSTGNEIKTTPDLVRRSLVAELFLAGDVAGRKFRRPMTLKLLAKPETRAGFLSACCAIVREWVANGQPLWDEPLASFEDWTSTIVGMMALHPFENPLIPPELSAGGAEDENEMRDLLVAVATAALGDAVYDRKALVAEARKLGLLENLVGTEDQGDLDSASSKKFGRQLQHWRGRELRDKNGRMFRFAHRKQKRGATYPLTFL